MTVHWSHVATIAALLVAAATPFACSGSSSSTSSGTTTGAGAAGSSGSAGGAMSGTGTNGTMANGTGTGMSTGANFTTTGSTGAGMCLNVGAACVGASDCCSGACTNNVCEFLACTSDGAACVNNTDCCGGNCNNGTCAPLNAQCKTLGNACTPGGMPGCCSGLCSNGVCSASSFCIQAGDVCVADNQCCGGKCNIAQGSLYGTCAPPPTGAANCTLTDGQLCNGGAIYMGGPLPVCGGECCSRACLPYGPTGVMICQPASGCHPVGDLCTTDGDCCGANGLPGGSGQPVTCDKSGGSTVGVCRNPMGCKPDGDVCKLATTSCNASCDCCSGNCQNKDTCHLDNVGVPRCAPAQCVNPGGACASSASCCNGVPCVPNPNGTPPFICSMSSCVPVCGGCTNNADCCSGETCDIPNGATMGVCGPCNPTTTSSSSSSSSSSGSGGSTGSGTTSTGTGMCALYGQQCTQASDCCNGVPCQTSLDQPCAGQGTCTCHATVN